MPRATYVDQPKAVLTVVAAQDAGFMVYDPAGPKYPIIQNNTVLTVTSPSTALFAGSLRECAEYVVQQMSPEGTEAPA